MPRPATKRQARYRLRRVSLIASWKIAPCLDCGHSWPPEVMEFDHVRGAKLFNVSDGPRLGKTVAHLRTEIEKCDLVCANCHRLRTIKRRRGTLEVEHG